jgi:choline-phosphate cytidylyltransferase
MDSSEPIHHRRILHSKRSFGKHPGHKIDSPAYDASVSIFLFLSPKLSSPLFSSEEDNDPEDGSSALSITSSLRQSATTQHRGPGPLTARPTSPPPRSRLKHTLSPSVLSDDGVDSPTYDGDIESSTTVGRDREHPSPIQSHSALTSTLPSPAPIIQPLPAVVAVIVPPSTASSSDAEIEPARVIVHNVTSAPPKAVPALNPATLSSEDIRAFVRRAIDGEIHRKYRINEPPVGRPVRVYADGTCSIPFNKCLSYGIDFCFKECMISFTMGMP